MSFQAAAIASTAGDSWVDIHHPSSNACYNDCNFISLDSNSLDSSVSTKAATGDDCALLRSSDGAMIGTSCANPSMHALCYSPCRSEILPFYFSLKIWLVKFIK